MGPKIPSRWDRSESKVRVCHFGETENINSDIPNWCQLITEGWQPFFGETETQNRMDREIRVWGNNWSGSSRWDWVCRIGLSEITYECVEKWRVLIVEGARSPSTWATRTLTQPHPLLIVLAFPMDSMWSLITKPKMESWAFANACLSILRGPLLQTFPYPYHRTFLKWFSREY